MKLLLLASGSGGHIYPCLAFCKYLLKQNVDVVYMGVKDSMEESIFLNVSTSKIYLKIEKRAKYYLKNPLKIKDIIYELKAHKELKDVDGIISFGGFMSFLGVLCHLLYRKKLFLHEQNVLLGDGNIFASKFAKKIFMSLPMTKLNSLQKRKSLYVGNPRFYEAFNYFKNKEIAHSKRMLFFFGSLGSKTVLKEIEKAIYELSNKFDVTVILGKNTAMTFHARKNLHVIEYVDDMLSLLSKMDVVIMRGGATSLSEILALKIPSIIIPSPFVKHDHQKANAQYFKKNKLSLMIEEKDISTNRIIKIVTQLVTDRLLRYKLINNMEHFNQNDVCLKMLESIKNEI